MSDIASSVCLSTLRRGQTAIIEDLAGPDEQVSHLACLGLKPGSFVRVLQPGLACAVCVDDTRVVLRATEARSILVTPLS